MAEATPKHWPFNNTAKARFWPKVNTSAGSEACWPWTGTHTYDGYGQFRTGGTGSPNLSASACAWALTHGRMPPEGCVVRHTCDVRDCCRPDHLILGTVQDNARDMTTRRRQHIAAGSRHLTDDDCREMVRRYLAGEKQCDLAAEFGTGQQNVSRLVGGRNRKYLNLHNPEAAARRLREERVERAREMARKRVAGHYS